MAARDLAAIVRGKDELSGELKSMGSELERFAGGFLKIPPAASAASLGMAGMAAAGVALGKMALDLGIVFDDAMDTIIVKTGASGAALERMGQTLDDVLRDIPTDVDQAGSAIAQLTTRLDLTGESLRRMATQELELARLTKSDLSENIRANSRLMQSWRVDTEEQSATLDKLFVAGQATGTSVAQLSQGVTAAGASLRGLGFSLDESITLMGQMDKSGTNSELAARGLKAALSELSQAGQDVPTSFRTYVDAIKNASSETEALALATALFGSRGAAELSDAIRRGVFDLDELTGKIRNAAGAIKDTSDKTQDAAEKWKRASNEMAVAFRPVGEAALTVASQVATAVAGMAREINDNKDILRAGLGLAAGGPIGAVIGAATGAGPSRSVNLTVQAPDLPPNAFDTAEEAVERAGLEMARMMTDKFGREFDAGLRRIDLGQQFGTEGGKAAAAFMAPFGDGWDKQLGSSLETLLSAMTTAGVTGGTELGAEIRTAINKAIADNSDESAQAVLSLFGRANQLLQTKRDEPRIEAEAKRAAEEAKREAESAIREAERIAAEWKRTMPISGANFAAELNRSAQGVGFGPGRGIFEGLTKAIEEGGEQNIQAVGRMTAEIQQRMRDGLGPEVGERWAKELVDRVNQAIADGSESSRAAVGQWVRAFDIESQLKVAGDRAATTINEAIQEAQRSIERAQVSAQERIDRLREDTKLAADREAERDSIQRRLDAGLETFRDIQGGRRLGTQQNREMEDIDHRRARESADLEDRRSQSVVRTAAEEKKLKDQIAEASSRGDVLAANRARLALQERQKATKDQVDEELKALGIRRQREDEDHLLRQQRQADDLIQAKRDATELQAERDRAFESSGMKGFLERIKGEDLDRSFRDILKGLDDTTGSINERLDELTNKTNTDMDTLREKLVGVKDVSDTLFDGAIEKASRLAALFGGTGQTATPGTGVGIDEQGNLQSLTVGQINITGVTEPGQVAAAIVQAEEALLASQ